MSDISYDKIKCLVEVDDDILAAFTIFWKRRLHR